MTHDFKCPRNDDQPSLLACEQFFEAGNCWAIHHRLKFFLEYRISRGLAVFANMGASSNQFSCLLGMGGKWELLGMTCDFKGRRNDDQPSLLACEQFFAAGDCWAIHQGLKSFLNLQIWPSLATNFHSLWVWELLRITMIQNDK